LRRTPYRRGELQFTDAANGNFELKSTSSYRAGAASAGADGADVGVDVRWLDQAAGKVSGVRVLKTGRTQAIARIRGTGWRRLSWCGREHHSKLLFGTSIRRYQCGQGPDDSSDWIDSGHALLLPGDVCRLEDYRNSDYE